MPGKDMRLRQVGVMFRGLLSRFRLDSKDHETPGQGQAREDLGAASLKSGSPTGRSVQASADGLPTVIHRLSQPLTALRGSIELALLAELSPAEYRAALKGALEQADRVVGLLDSLRDWAESEDPGDLTECVLLGTVVEEALEHLLPLADSRGLSVVFQSGVDLYVRVNSTRLRRAILKVIHHAIDRSPERGRVRVELSTSQGNAFLVVSDEGPAAEPPELDSLRGTMTLGHLFSEASKRGSLDWAVAKNIFEAQGGAARVENTAGSGCSFRVSLPLASP